MLIALLGALRFGAPGLGVARAQLLPFEHNPAVPIDPRQAFVEGIRAVQDHDYAMAIGRLQLASEKVPEVGDYALFYLGRAREGMGDRNGAADAYREVGVRYPQSVLADAATTNYARLRLAAGDPATARILAEAVANRTNDTGVDQNARWIIAQAAYAQGNLATAYNTVQQLREAYPGGAFDGQARALAYRILPDYTAINRYSLSYRRAEAALLIAEGQRPAALAQIDRALAVAPTSAELYWMRARAVSGDDDQERRALLHYLALAPHGEHAAASAKRLARLAWRVKDTTTARYYFRLVEARYPADAAEAAFEIGRTYEDDGDRDAARSVYEELVRRGGNNEYVESARFRAPFMLYMEGRYQLAANQLADAVRHATSAGDRDMFTYWQARALEQSGSPATANVLYHTLAASTASNYYPTLAARRIGPVAVVLPAASVADPIAGPVPAVTGRASFHLMRVAAFRAMDLRDFEAVELRAIAREPGLQDFVLAELQAAGAWYDAIQLANVMTARGELNPALAERIRYPRGFWDLVNGAATQQQLDPWLVAALIRQESLYNPQARSGSDARGLMQLLPSTASHWAPAAGLSPAALNLYDPTVSVRIGTTYLKGLFAMFNGNPIKAVAAYNGGEHAVAEWNTQYPGDDDQWVENIGYRETRDYVKKVIGGMREYELLYGGKSTASVFPPAARSPG